MTAFRLIALLLPLSLFPLFVNAKPEQPERISYAELHKMASTGMRLGKEYEVTAKLLYISQNYLCDPSGGKCDSSFWIPASDDSMLLEGKRNLYDLRGKVGCFTVTMLSGSYPNVHVLHSKPGVCSGDKIASVERNVSSNYSGTGVGLFHYILIGSAIGFIIKKFGLGGTV